MGPNTSISKSSIFYYYLQNDTEVKVVWAYHSSNDADVSLTARHTARGILSGRHNLIMMAMLAMQSPSTTVGIQPSATMITPTSSKDSGGPTTAPPSYESLASLDGYFKLQWTYVNKKLIFIITCKTTGWCAVGFTINPGGRFMNNYDIVAGGFASGAGYIGVSQSKLCCCFSLFVSVRVG